MTDFQDKYIAYKSLGTRAKVFITLDLTLIYWQIPLHEDSQPLKGFWIDGKKYI